MEIYLLIIICIIFALFIAPIYSLIRGFSHLLLSIAVSYWSTVDVTLSFRSFFLPSTHEYRLGRIRLSFVRDGNFFFKTDVYDPWITWNRIVYASVVLLSWGAGVWVTGKIVWQILSVTDFLPNSLISSIGFLVLWDLIAPADIISTGPRYEIFRSFSKSRKSLIEAYSHLELGETKSALKEFEQAIDDERNYILFYNIKLQLAHGYVESGCYEEAIKIFLELAESEYYHLNVQDRLHMVTCYDYANDPVQALDLLETEEYFAEESEEEAQVRLTVRGLLLLCYSNKPEIAVELLEKAIKKDPKAQTYYPYASFGKIHFHLLNSQPEEAVQILDPLRGVLEERYQPTIKLFHGVIHKINGDLKKSKELFEEIKGEKDLIYHRFFSRWISTDEE